MNKFEKQFIDGILEQIAQARTSLVQCKKNMEAVDEKYRLLAEQEKKDLKEEEESLQKIITVLDTSTMSLYGRSATSFLDFSDNVEEMAQNEYLNFEEQPATPEESVRVPESPSDMSELEALKKKLEESEHNGEGDDFDVDKMPAPVEEPQPEPETEEESEANEEVEQIAESIDDWGDEQDSKEPDAFEDFGGWPDIDEDFK